MVNNSSILTYLEIQFSLDNEYATTVTFFIYLLGVVSIARGKKFHKFVFFLMIFYRMKTFVTGFYVLLILMSLYLKMLNENAGLLRLEEKDINKMEEAVKETSF